MKNSIAFLLIATSLLNANAQKLPNVQQLSLRAPVNIKIDGKLNEWGELKTYNNNTQLYYTIANDKDNLYLTVRITDPKTLQKVLTVGLTFTVNHIKKKKDSTTTAFTFPFYDNGQKPMAITTRQIIDKLPTDSSAFYNKKLLSTIKLIGVNGVKNMDSYITIYNDMDIKADALFDKDMYYNYELAVPLKLLDDAIDRKSAFNYNLQVNGQTSFDGYAVKALPGRNNFLYFTDNKGINYHLDEGFTDLYYPTDFWGEYTLAK